MNGAASGFITRAELRPGAGAAILTRAAARDDGHALVWTLFQHRGRGERCFLYRGEGPGRYLVVSTEPPEDPEGLWRVASKPYEPELAAGEALRFALRVNPAVTTKVDGHPKRTDAVMHAKAHLMGDARRGVDKGAAVEAWLRPRLEARGARLDAFALTGWRVDDRARAGQGRHTRSVADIEGTLTVTDPAPFTQCLFAGLGKARAYGCGLLLVRRA